VETIKTTNATPAKSFIVCPFLSCSSTMRDVAKSAWLDCRRSLIALAPSPTHMESIATVPATTTAITKTAGKLRSTASRRLPSGIRKAGSTIVGAVRTPTPIPGTGEESRSTMLHRSATIALSILPAAGRGRRPHPRGQIRPPLGTEPALKNAVSRNVRKFQNLATKIREEQILHFPTRVWPRPPPRSGATRFRRATSRHGLQSAA